MDMSAYSKATFEMYNSKQEQVTITGYFFHKIYGYDTVKYLLGQWEEPFWKGMLNGAVIVDTSGNPPARLIACS